jgi:hypothetical protein
MENKNYDVWNELKKLTENKNRDVINTTLRWYFNLGNPNL